MLALVEIHAAEESIEFAIYTHNPVWRDQALNAIVYTNLYYSMMGFMFDEKLTLVGR